MNATIVIPLPTGTSLSTAQLNDLLSALAADYGSSLAVSAPVLAYDAATGLPFVKFVVMKRSGPLSSALQASLSTAAAYLKSQGVALAEVAGCVACTDSSMCDGTAAQSSCRSLTAGPSQSATCSAGCIAGIVAGATFVVCTAVFMTALHFKTNKASVSPEQ